MKIILDYLLKRYYDIAKFREVLMENAIARNTETSLSNTQRVTVANARSELHQRWHKTVLPMSRNHKDRLVQSVTRTVGQGWRPKRN